MRYYEENEKPLKHTSLNWMSPPNPFPQVSKNPTKGEAEIA